MMMEFVMMALAFAVGSLMATGIMVFIMMQPGVMKLYTKKVMKLTNEIVAEIVEENEIKDL